MWNHMCSSQDFSTGSHCSRMTSLPPLGGGWGAQGKCGGRGVWAFLGFQQPEHFPACWTAWTWFLSCVRSLDLNWAWKTTTLRGDGRFFYRFDLVGVGYTKSGASFIPSLIPPFSHSFFFHILPHSLGSLLKQRAWWCCYLKNWIGLLAGVEPIDTTKPKSRRRKGFSLLAASEENTGDISQSSVSRNSKTGEVLS